MGAQSGTGNTSSVRVAPEAPYGFQRVYIVLPSNSMYLSILARIEGILLNGLDKYMLLGS